MKFLDTLKAEHRQLLAQVEEMEKILTGLRANSLSPKTLDALRELLQQFVELLASHDELEKKKLFPALRRHLPKDDEWQVGMLEIQDEMILREARNLHGLASVALPSLSVAQLKEAVERVVRWMRVHVRIEDEHLIPRLQDLPLEKKRDVAD